MDLHNTSRRIYGMHYDQTFNLWFSSKWLWWDLYFSIEWTCANDPIPIRRKIKKTQRHILTWSNGNICVLLAICAGNSPVPGEFPTQRPVTRSFDDFFDLRLNKRLSKRSWGWWLETLSRPLWRHRNEPLIHSMLPMVDAWWGNKSAIR